MYQKQQIALNNIEREIRDLENYKEEIPQHDMSDLEEGLRNCEQLIQKFQEEKKEAQQAEIEMNKQIQPFEQQSKEKAKEISRLLKESESMGVRIHSLQPERHIRKTRKKQ